MGKRALHWVALAAIVTMGMVFPKAAAAQKLIKGDNFSLTFPSGWDTVKSSNVVGKYGGLSGMATLGATPGTEMPDLDSLAQFYSDSLGGHITADSSGAKLIGGRTVQWQQFKYDSLPKLSTQISAQTGLQVNLKDGNFRVYYLKADGFVFTLALMSILPGGIMPYADVEKAISTLKLGGQAGIFTVARAGGRDLWVRNGKLGGSWLKSHKVFAVDCYDSRGALIGSATHAPEGAWSLPASRLEMFISLRTADGAGLNFSVHP
ncbi:MAG: hypothetical protein JWP91_2847 [Fibrobacteres bacterium]|nr:hypothetical protein [Fibrobacterota bacterium]